jgi:predicted HicB family RNase H-like nuclease
MTDKGYAAHIEYRDENTCFDGSIAGIADVIGFLNFCCFFIAV